MTDGSDGPGSTALVVGAGLIGTSAALALTAAGWQVWLQDTSPAALGMAADLGAGEPALPADDPSVVLVCVPPMATPGVVTALMSRYRSSVFTDTSSVKHDVELEIEARGADMRRFVGGHPMAGRERSGPAAARADLFTGRPWVLTPRQDRTRQQALSAVLGAVRACGAVPVTLGPDVHDQAVALVSHVPQIVASLTAARLVDAQPHWLELAGQGLRDTTRIADSDPGLWVQILAANAGPVRQILDQVAADLDKVRAELVAVERRSAHKSADGEAASAARSGQSGALPITAEIMRQGARGRAGLPGKHGTAPTTFTSVPVIVADRPGELARLLVAAGEAGVNVEDVSIEHSAGQPVGLVELSVRPDAAPRLRAALRSGGWAVHG